MLDRPRWTPRPGSRVSAVLAGALVAACASCTSTPADPPPRSASSGSSGSSAPGAGVVDAVAAGATGDGRTDDAAVLQRVLDGLPPGGTLRLAAGRTFAVGGVLVVRVRGTHVTGGGTLLATDESRSSLLVDGAAGADDVHLEGIRLAISRTTRRWDAAEQQRLRIDGGTGAVVRGVEVDGSAAAGVYVGGGASGFTLDRVRVRDTRADGIHMTQGAHDGAVTGARVTRSGDDGVSVVSYARDGAPCHDITVEHPVVRGTGVGRGVSVVGGRRITYRHVDVDSSGAAGVYVATEGSYDTAGVDDVRVEGGRVTRANQDTATDHGAVLVYDGSGRALTGVVVRDLAVTGTRATASRQVGVLDDGGGSVSGVRLDRISISGGPQRALVVGPGLAVETSGWSRQGRALSDPAAGG